MIVCVPVILLFMFIFCCNLEIIILLTLMMTSGAAMSRSITQCSVASARQFNFVVITTWLTYFIIFAWGPRFKISEDILCGGVQSWLKLLVLSFLILSRIKWDKLEAKCQFAGLLLVSNLEGKIVWTFTFCKLHCLRLESEEKNGRYYCPRPGPSSVIGGLPGMNNGL